MVQVLNSGRTKDSLLAALSRTIWLEKALGDFEMRLEHIPGVQNCVADMLSRWGYMGSVPYLAKMVPDYQWCQVTNQMLCLNMTI